MRNKKGFTLIELLIVIGIIAILAAIVFVAVDPARRLAEARNAERWSSVNAILNGILKYTVDEAGIPTWTETAVDSDDTTVQIIGENLAAVACGSVPACAGESIVSSSCFVDTFDDDLVDTYLSSIPTDPATGDSDDTRYFINKSANGRITVGACDEEAAGGSTPVISVAR